jgi:hypothetical protein
LLLKGAIGFGKKNEAKSQIGDDQGAEDKIVMNCVQNVLILKIGNSTIL